MIPWGTEGVSAAIYKLFQPVRDAIEAIRADTAGNNEDDALTDATGEESAERARNNEYPTRSPETAGNNEYP